MGRVLVNICTLSEMHGRKRALDCEFLWALNIFLIAQLIKKSACNAGDPGSIPESGRPAGEGIVYPLQYAWASLVAQLVKNLFAMRETWV